MSTSELKWSMTTFTSTGSRDVLEDWVEVDHHRGIMVVADGFGGPKAGDEAAKIACSSVVEFLSSQSLDREATLPFALRKFRSFESNLLFNAIAYANQKVLHFNDKRDVNQRGGSSLVASYFRKNRMTFGGIGTCRAIALRSGQKTTLLPGRGYQQMMDPFSPRSPDGNVEDFPLASLGIFEDVEPDLREYELSPGDWVLLCSDGLGESFENEFVRLQLERLSEKDAFLEVRRLLERYPFKDNVSISLGILS